MEFILILGFVVGVYAIIFYALSTTRTLRRQVDDLLLEVDELRRKADDIQRLVDSLP